MNLIEIMKTIEQTAIENYFEFEQQSAFKDGVEFAQRWIPVEEELPTQLRSYLVKRKDLLGVEHHEVLKFGVSCAEDTPHWSTKYPELITHWRYIDLV